MKLTLTPAEHKRVDQVMGVPNMQPGGKRLCRCGTRVSYTPDAMWSHARACERRARQEAERQTRAIRRAAAQEERKVQRLAERERRLQERLLGREYVQAERAVTR